MARHSDEFARGTKVPGKLRDIVVHDPTLCITKAGSRTLRHALRAVLGKLEKINRESKLPTGHRLIPFVAHSLALNLPLVENPGEAGKFFG